MPLLPEITRRAGRGLAFVPLVLAAFFTVLVLFLRSVASWFDDQNP